MNNKNQVSLEEKINCIRNIKETNLEFDNVYEMLEEIGDVKYNYTDYMITEPIKVDEELKRISNANYDLCAALLTMILREERFSSGSYNQRVELGQVKEVLEKMVEILKTREIMV